MAEPRIPTGKRITAATVRADFNDPVAVVHYARAAHRLGLWASERQLIERAFPDRGARLLELGCGAGRVTLGLWELGYRRLTAIDFAAELVAQAQALVTERGVHGLDLFRADATRMPLAAEDDPAARLRCRRVPRFDGALFMFNGLMQIPGRARRRRALREIHRLVAIDAPLLFTTHDRDDSREERLLWKLEARRWARGQQDPRLVDFGDRYFEDEAGRTFMHLPTRDEILEDLAATGWRSEYDIMRRHVARETAAVREFSDECRFWLARALPA
jgi:SAM-dependent methyltransferase